MGLEEFLGVYCTSRCVGIDNMVGFVFGFGFLFEFGFGFGFGFDFGFGFGFGFGLGLVDRLISD